jgi:hypothetical protein
LFKIPSSNPGGTKDTGGLLLSVLVMGINRKCRQGQDIHDRTGCIGQSSKPNRCACGHTEVNIAEKQGYDNTYRDKI